MEISDTILNDLAQNLEMGMQTYIHKDTLEIFAIPTPEMLLDFEDYWKEDIKIFKKNKKKLIEIKPIPSHESYKLMEKFVELVDDKRIRGKLLTALGGRKPFAHFKNQVDYSGPYREMWFAFKNEQMMNWVRQQLKIKM